tara:strand:+ start:282 stop:392 length:111 start_codon:yes stop_codon:yes gene_type:complete
MIDLSISLEQKILIEIKRDFAESVLKQGVIISDLIK